MSDLPTGPRRSRAAQDFDDAYRSGQAPWDIGRPQAAFQELAERGMLTGRVLDVGCGTGEHTLMAAALGLDATGVDVARTAVTTAERKAEERGLTARFLTWDVLALDDLAETFDTVLDCGLFHVFDDADRVRYVEALGSVTARGATYHVLCFSDREPGDWGPRRVREDDLRAAFSDGWSLAAIEPATLETTMEGGGAHAWRARAVRT